MPDVTIIGAGPAGSVAALLLARANWRVTLLEQHRFPRDKVCGECLSADGIEVLSRIGLRESIEALHPIRLTRSIFTGADGPAATFDLPREMWGIPRSVMDARLLNAARDAGANVLQPWRCEHVTGGVCPVVRARDLETNEIRELSPHYVVVADGKAAFGAARPETTGDFGLKAHFADVDAPGDAIMLLGAHGPSVGVPRVTETAWNVALSVPQARLRACDGDGDRVIEMMKTENETLAAVLAGARRMTDWLAGRLPRFGVATEWPRRVIPIGNAAAALEPIGGEGMGLAMRSAELAVDALVSAQRDGVEVDVTRLRRSYGDLWNTRRFASRASALAVSHPTLAQAVLPMAQSGPLARLAMSWMGK